MKVRLSVLLLVFGICAGSGLGANPPTSGAFQNCPVEGKGGDTVLNKLKNRSAASDSSTARSLSSIVNLLDPGVTNRRPRDKWTNEQLSRVRGQESQAVTVEGFLIGFKKEGQERCNCSNPDLNDFHLWLAPRGDLAKDDAVVIEVTPRWRGANSSWSEDALKHLKAKRAKVRITGWLLYDQDHLNEIGNSRATVWEIHPITKIEVFLDGEWQEL
jgi:hypothetical protein